MKKSIHNLTNQEIMNAVVNYLESYYPHTKDQITYMLKEGMKEPTEHLDGMAYCRVNPYNIIYPFGFKIIKKEVGGDHIIPPEELKNLTTECDKHQCNCMFYIIVRPCGCVQVYKIEKREGEGEREPLGPAGTTIEVGVDFCFNIFDN